MNRFFAFFTLLGLSGCISNIDRVAPMSWTYYLGGSAKESEIRMALLECGSNVPGESIEFSSPDGKGFLLPQQGLNEIILVRRCMQNAGFSYSGDKETCKRWKDLPACKPDAVIPARSVTNRVNSPYCKLIPKAKLCQPDYDPAAVETSTPTNPKPISVAPSTDLATKLQDQVQKGGNAQMNQLQQGSGSRR